MSESNRLMFRPLNRFDQSRGLRFAGSATSPNDPHALEQYAVIRERSASGLADEEFALVQPFTLALCNGYDIPSTDSGGVYEYACWNRSVTNRICARSSRACGWQAFEPRLPSRRRDRFRGKAMALDVRMASIADVDALVRLNREVQSLHAELEPTYFKADTASDEVRAFFRAKLEAPDNHIRLSDGDTGPNGYVWFEIQERPGTPFTLPNRRVYVHHLAVEKMARRCGIASALLARVETEARSAGIDNVVLDVWAANASARSFFTAHGFASFNLMLRKISPDSV